MPEGDEGWRVRPAVPRDAEALARIYNHYVRATIITFEEEDVAPREMESRVREVEAASLPWLVAENGAGAVAGFAHASKWKGRCAYRYSAEVTVYVDPDGRGRGAGASLYASLISMLRERGVHVLLAGIALPNEASVAIHEKFGFEKVAHLKEVGFKFEKWIDVGYWQLTLASHPRSARGA
jgi:L-amino acid N-acyltransferase YncA